MTAKRKRPKVPVAIIQWDPKGVESESRHVSESVRANPARKPKVRYVAQEDHCGNFSVVSVASKIVVLKSEHPHWATYATRAMNLYEAVRRGEL